PTPTERPTPTPKPPPSLERAVETWAINGMLKGTVFLQDKKSNQEWMMDKDFDDMVSRIVDFQGESMEIFIVDTDPINMTATFEYKHRDGVQRVTKGMFDE